MKRFRLSMALCVAMLLVLTPLAPRAAAQTGNLLTNGGFESQTGDYGSGWSPWWTETAKPSDGSYNYAYRPSWSIESKANGAAADFVYAGDKSQRVINNWDPWWAGVKLVANAPAGARVRLTVFARVWTAGNFWPTPTDTTVPARVTVGLDPNGSDNQYAGSVIWSGAIIPHGGWQPVSVEATVGAGGKVGVFLSADYRGSSRLFMGAFFDEASLTVVSTGTAPTAPPSSGGATQAPPPPAAPVATPVPFVMPTPGADGNIVYTVKSGDTAWSIAGSAGISLDQLVQFNPGLNTNLIFVGQKLVIGQGQPSTPPTATAAPQPTTDPNAQPTAAPQPTDAPQPTAAAAANTGEMCVALFEDLNGNGQQDANEVALAGGSLTVLDAGTGAPVQAYTTQPGEAVHCFQNLAAGSYTLAAAPPTGYNPTNANTVNNIALQAGARADIAFGAQKSSTTADPAAAPATADDRMRTALFGAAGIMLILLAAGLGAFLFLRRR